MKKGEANLQINHKQQKNLKLKIKLKARKIREVNPIMKIILSTNKNNNYHKWNIEENNKKIPLIQKISKFKNHKNQK